MEMHPHKITADFGLDLDTGMGLDGPECLDFYRDISDFDISNGHGNRLAPVVFCPTLFLAFARAGSEDAAGDDGADGSLVIGPVHKGALSKNDHLEEIAERNRMCSDYRHGYAEHFFVLLRLFIMDIPGN
jgi:hypothetical protein